MPLVVVVAAESAAYAFGRAFGVGACVHRLLIVSNMCSKTKVNNPSISVDVLPRSAADNVRHARSRQTVMPRDSDQAQPGRVEAADHAHVILGELASDTRLRLVH